MRRLIVALVGLLFIVSCGGDDGGESISGEAVTVNMFDNRFEYTEITVPVGGSVTFVGAGRNAHNAVAADESWSTEDVFGSLEQFEGDEATLTFDQVGDGLVAKDGELTGFTIAGADQKFVPATAKIVKTKIEVSSPDVPEPKAVRYAWKNMPDGNLWNKAGLPASPFRTDNWAQPATSAPAKRTPAKTAQPEPKTK